MNHRTLLLRQITRAIVLSHRSSSTNSSAVTRIHTYLILQTSYLKFGLPPAALSIIALSAYALPLPLRSLCLPSIEYRLPVGALA